MLKNMLGFYRCSSAPRACRLVFPLSIVLAGGGVQAQPAPEYETGGHRINVARNQAVVGGLVAPGGVEPIAFSLVSGSLPVGLSLNQDGSIVGTSIASGEHAFRARVEDANADSGEADFVLTVNPPSLQGSVQAHSFVSPSTGLEVPFSLYLPAGYAVGGSRYPVVYHLHGIGGAHNGGQVNTLPRSFEAAHVHGLIRDAIIVFPDGFVDSFWADGIGGDKPAETHLVSDLVSHVDANYRTLAEARFRVASGFSMGGFGAAKLATKFPDRFATGVIYDGAMLPWEAVQSMHPVQAEQVFGNSAATFDLYSPYFWVEQNAGPLSGPTRLRSAVGALVTRNEGWSAAVSAAQVGMDEVATGLPHSLGPLLDAQGANMWIFIESRWESLSNPLFLDGFEGPF